MVTHVILLVCKDSAKFRFSEGNENKFSFLSVRKLTKTLRPSGQRKGEIYLTYIFIILFFILLIVLTCNGYRFTKFFRK